MKEKTKVAIRFAVIMIGCMLLGCLVGMLIGNLNPEDLQLSAESINHLAYAVPVGYWILNFVMCIWGFALYFHDRSLLRNGEGDEELLNRMEYALDFPMLLTSVMVVLNMFLMGVVMFLTEKCTLSTGTTGILVVAGFACLAFGYVWILVLQSKVIALVKEMNPEKQGYVLDFRFQKVWMDSCDEGQKLMVYRAGFSAYKAATFACIAAWVIAFIGIFTFDTGLLPLLLVSAIFMTLVVSYMVASMKQERPEK